MTITDAKAIPLYQLVQHLGGRYAHTDGHRQLWYYSPFRPNEKTPSFKINEAKGRWHDFGHVARNTSSANGSGGDILDLWCDYHGKDRRKALVEALDALKALFGSTGLSKENPALKRPAERRLPHDRSASASSRFRILALHDRIFYPSLNAELQRRRIAPDFAAKHLKQVYLQDSVYPDKKQNGFAFRNDRNGWEISIPNPRKGTTFKTSTKPKAPTTFRIRLSSKLLVFEGFWDYLSWFEMQATPDPEHNIVVLNSLSFCAEITSHIVASKETLETVMLFLDNDTAGVQAAQTMQEQLEGEGITTRNMASLYQNYKDLSEYWSKDPSARRVMEQNAAASKYYHGDSAWHTATAAAQKGRPRYE